MMTQSKVHKPAAKAKALRAPHEMEFRTSTRVFFGVALALLLVVGCGGWAATADLNGAVIASGAVKVDRNMKAVQHRDGGIIKDIRVREGDTVKKGDVLLVLDDVQTRAELSIVRSQIFELTGRRARLQAERDGQDHIQFPDGYSGGTEAALAAGHVRLFAGNLANRKSQIQQLEFQITQLGEEVRGLQAQLKAKVGEMDLIEVEYGKLKPLFARGLIENTRIYSIERERARMAGERGGIEASMARAKARISEIRLQVIAIEQNGRTEAQRELSDVEAKLSEARDRLIAIEDRLSRTDIRSPIDGTVNELLVHTIGGVITPAERLITLVPHGAELKVEAKIAPADIDQVSVGQTARLKFSTFNQSITPEFKGQVTHVSPATARDAATNQTYYMAEIEISDDLGRLGRKLKPGMLVDIFITTETRTAISFLVKPLTDKFSRAFREE
jgi:HlyD family secretion protein